MNRRGFFGLIGSMVLGSVVVAKAKTSNMVKFPSGSLKRRPTVYSAFKQQYMLPMDRVTATDIANANGKLDDKIDSLYYQLGKGLSENIDRQIIKTLKG